MWNYKAEVVRVIDGDTVVVLVDLGFSTYKKEHLRLARIDAWELRGEEREKGLVAKGFVEKALPAGSSVVITTEKMGKYGRYIAEVEYGDGENLSDRLMEDGHAVLYGSEGKL